MGKPYIPSFTAPFQLVLPTKPPERPIIFGQQDPEGVVPGVPGQYYVNTSTMMLYIKMGGVQETGWRQIGIYVPQEGGGEGGGAVFSGPYANPNGYISARAPAIYYSYDGTVWVQTSTELNNTHWAQLIA